MTIRVELSSWVSHSNMLLSAALRYHQKSRRPISLHCDATSPLPPATFYVEVGGKRAFVDYRDRFELHPLGSEADRYFKRSLVQEDAARGVLPLGFHFNYSAGLHRLLLRPGFARVQNKIEIGRSLDVLGLTGGSHFERRIDDTFRPPRDGGGRVIFYVRLWDPERNREPEEQERRRKMNHVRIEAVRGLRKLANTAAGIIPDDFARRLCPDLLLTRQDTTTKGYFAQLQIADIGIANEGLRGSPGWKIGEYVASSKAVISNLIDCTIPGFAAGQHYSLFEDPREIPDLVHRLRSTKAYRDMQHANWKYTLEHLHPDVYFERLVEQIENPHRS